MTPVQELIGVVADFAHRQWSGWMRYMFSKCIKQPDGSVVIPAEYVERWERQMKTAYHDLPDSESDSDRKEAIKFLSIIYTNQ